MLKGVFTLHTIVENRVFCFDLAKLIISRLNGAPRPNPITAKVRIVRLKAAEPRPVLIKIGRCDAIVVDGVLDSDLPLVVVARFNRLPTLSSIRASVARIVLL